MGGLDRRHPGRGAALHPARRIPPPFRDRGADVRGHDPLALVAPGRADALERRDVHDVLGGVRVVGRDRGDHRHDRGRGDPALRLQRALLPRHGGGGRNPRDPDPALHQHDRLRGPHRDLDPAALPRRHGPGPRARLALRDHRRHRLRGAAALGRAAAGDELADALAEPSRPHPAPHHLRGGHRLHLRRARDPHRIRRARRHHRGDPHRPPALVADAAGGGGGHHAQHRHDHGDPGRRLLPQLRAELHRAGRPGERARARHRADPDGHPDGGGAVLSRARDVHGDPVHDDRDGAPHHPGHHRARVRPGVVRGSS